MLQLPKLEGNIRQVPVDAYQELIDIYLDKIKDIPSIDAVIRMGSFSTPGISDIDIILTFKNGISLPTWDQISLKKLTADHPYSEVIAHDIFVLPEDIARKAEGYFYIDQQHVLLGTKLGGELSKDKVAMLREFLTLEYSIFTLEAIVNIFLGKSTNIRQAILLLSTSRHTAALAYKVNLMSEQEKNEYIKSIENIRHKILVSTVTSKELTPYFIKFIHLLYRVSFYLSEKLTIGVSMDKYQNKWKTSNKITMFGLKNKDTSFDLFKRLMNQQQRLKLNRFSKIIPVPYDFQKHLAGYVEVSEFFKSRYPKYQGSEKNKFFKELRQIRQEVIHQQWDFIIKNNYYASSGKGYCGFGFNPVNHSLKSKITQSISTFHSKFLVGNDYD